MAKEVITVSIESDLVQKARALALADNRTLSNWVEVAIKKAVEKEEG
jgi:post-segregation antitoxin (ccd killing protein)